MVVCAAVVVTVIVPFTTVLGPLPVTGDEVQVASAGSPAQLKLTGPKFVEAMIPMVVLPDAPGLLIVTFDGPETATKPGEMVKVVGVVLVLSRKLLSPA